jgi:hypothetical protein
MAHIVYSIRGAAPREIKVPTVTEARHRFWLKGGKLEQFVMELGELQGAARYCRECFSYSGAVTHLALHDGGGPLQRFI